MLGSSRCNGLSLAPKRGAKQAQHWRIADVGSQQNTRLFFCCRRVDGEQRSGIGKRAFYIRYGRSLQLSHTV